MTQRALRVVLVVVVAGSLGCGSDPQPAVIDASTPDAGVRKDASTPDAPADEDVTLDAPAEASAPDLSWCSTDGWCWTHPYPQGNALRAVWRIGAKDVWFGGTAGTLLHWDGSAFTSPKLGVSDAIEAMWGSSATDVWAVGDRGLRVHFDGKTWTVVQQGQPSMHYRAIHGTSPSDVLVVGDGGVTEHFDGSKWSTMAQASDDLRAVFGTSPTDAWRAGLNGRIDHWNGAAWSPTSSGSTGTIGGLWATDATHVWAVDATRGVLLGDGSSWTLDPKSQTMLGFSRLSGTSPSDLWLSGGGLAHWDGVQWTRGAEPSWMNDALAVGPTEAYAVGERSDVLQYDGAKWLALTRGDTSDVDSLAPLSANLVFAAGFSQKLSWNGQDWMSNAFGNGGGTTALCAIGSKEAWSFGGYAMHYNGVWSDIPTPGDPDTHGGGASASNDAWAWSLGRVTHWNGATWSPYESVLPSTIIHGLWSKDPSDAWLVGAGNKVMHFDGVSWQPVPFAPIVSLGGVWGDGTGLVYVAGDFGSIYRWNGSTWDAMTSGTTEYLADIYGLSPKDVWVVGEHGTILHYDGLSWTRSESGTDVGLKRVRADATHVWVSGRNGAILSKKR
ncbi:MAG TPA: hypothetical protein VF316_24200 [Polyangiaceae bacterium]